MSASWKLRDAFSVGLPAHRLAFSSGSDFPGHWVQASDFLQVSVAMQYSFPIWPQDTGELVTELRPERLESSFSCISIQRCMLPILVFLSTKSRGHFLGHRFRRVTLSLPTEAALQEESCASMLSKRLTERKYLYLLLECFPRPEKLKTFPVMFTDGSVTSSAPGAFQRTVYFTERKIAVSFCAHWKEGETCCTCPYFGSSVRRSSSASSLRLRTAFRTEKDKSTFCSWDLATSSRARDHHCRITTSSMTSVSSDLIAAMCGSSTFRASASTSVASSACMSGDEEPFAAAEPSGTRSRRNRHMALLRL
mmetsp:Transcript_92507/g.220160  ORF Transcript_92507/g.220160 Transcript_92507/m.220160 type:complete len:308 (-) Transcript_92507:43-966(-)